jgi:magnesium chelatase family protein
MSSAICLASRAAALINHLEMPAQFLLTAAMNPCPCGYRGHRHRPCVCTPPSIARYRGRVSGPLLDRIDLQVEVPAVKPAQLMREADGEWSATIAARVGAARERQLRRQGEPNAAIEPGRIDALCRLDDGAAQLAQSAATRLGWSARGLHRALKVARTIADLAGAERIGSAHLAEALQYRRSLASS